VFRLKAEDGMKGGRMGRLGILLLFEFCKLGCSSLNKKNGMRFFLLHYLNHFFPNLREM